jgi:hypothetical protein
MTRSTRLLTVTFVLALATGAFTWVTSDSAHAQPQPPGPPGRPVKGDVVLMRCSAIAAEFPLTSYQGSAGTPGRKTGGCADNLSALLKDGYEIRNFGHYDDEKTGFVVYTLVR